MQQKSFKSTDVYAVFIVCNSVPLPSRPWPPCCPLRQARLQTSCEVVKFEKDKHSPNVSDWVSVGVSVRGRVWVWRVTEENGVNTKRMVSTQSFSVLASSSECCPGVTAADYMNEHPRGGR